MTDAILRGARSAAAPGITVTGLTPDGAPSPRRAGSAYLSAAAVLDTLRGHRQPYDAVVMTGFGEHGREGARELLDVPVVDGVGAAVELAESLVALGLSTSRTGGYARPLPKRRSWGRTGAERES
ncbi:aspartate/glutamate racemase family protein [Streptomyces sp. NPDC087850]|uniref:aspartate/glutamate racemase family protein n=1 Tax=Streptomyces sp. NPDC087850 TaxID=3365809 RepID=UPI00382DE2D8